MVVGPRVFLPGVLGFVQQQHGRNGLGQGAFGETIEGLHGRLADFLGVEDDAIGRGRLLLEPRECPLRIAGQQHAIAGPPQTIAKDVLHLGARLDHHNARLLLRFTRRRARGVRARRGRAGDLVLGGLLLLGQPPRGDAQVGQHGAGRLIAAIGVEHRGLVHHEAYRVRHRRVDALDGHDIEEPRPGEPLHPVPRLL